MPDTNKLRRDLSHLLVNMAWMGERLTSAGRISGAVLLNAVDKVRKAEAPQAREAAAEPLTEPEDLP